MVVDSNHHIGTGHHFNTVKFKMNIWPLFIALGRLGVIWVANRAYRKMFLTMVTVAFVMYHFHNEFEKENKRKDIMDYDG